MENKNNSPVNIRFVAKTSDIMNFFENISDVMSEHQKWQQHYRLVSLVLKLGFANPGKRMHCDMHTGKFQGVLGWQLSFHVLLFFKILY